MARRITNESRRPRRQSQVGLQPLATGYGEGIAKRPLAVIGCAAVFFLGVGGASLAAGCSGQNSDEKKPLIVTFTENGTVKVVTTGP
jgi:hypothetical protein